MAWDHRQIVVAHLDREHPEVSSWWRQSITVGYEPARGMRTRWREALERVVTAIA